MTGRLAVIVASLVIALLIAAPKLTVAALLVVLGVFGAAAWRHRAEASLGNIRDNRLIIIAIVGVALVAFASSGWHVLNDLDYMALAKVVAIFVAGVLAFSIRIAIPDAMRRAVQSGLLTGFAVGFVVIVIAAAIAAVTGVPLWGSFYYDPLTTLNNSAAMLALLFWPAIVVAWSRSHWLAVILAMITAGLLSVLSSTAAIVALLIGFAVLLGRRFVGRNCSLAGAATIAVLLIALPSFLNWAEKNWDEVPKLSAENPPIVKNSFQHRLAMWAFVSKRIEEKPMLGWGFNSSRHIPQEEYRLAPNMEIMPLHPHSLALQTRLELGVPGVLVLAGLVFVVFYRVATFTDDGWKSGVAMAAATSWLFIANVSYGMWQSWWIALAFLLALLMKIALAANSGEPR